MTEIDFIKIIARLVSYSLIFSSLFVLLVHKEDSKWRNTHKFNMLVVFWSSFFQAILIQYFKVSKYEIVTMLFAFGFLYSFIYVYEIKSKNIIKLISLSIFYLVVFGSNYLYYLKH